jgi:POT family proton-dependent oligopeptide transporter
LYIDSAKFKVGSSWLFWFYILCTLGELCLSPVGLSMVSKLAPRRFATMLMGMWLLTSFFGNFLAGLAGENWELLEPKNYFLYVTLAMLGASAICFVLVQVITKMMHGVR